MIPPPYSDKAQIEAWDAGVRAAEKRAVLLTMLDAGPVLVHIYAVHTDVVVPKEYAHPVLALRLGYKLTPPIPDLHVDRRGWSATLTFQGVPFPCVVPWNAVYAMKREDADQSASWIDDAPQIIRERVMKIAADAKAEVPPVPSKAKLKLVP